MMVAARRAFRGYYSNAEFGDDVPFCARTVRPSWRPLEIRGVQAVLFQVGLRTVIPCMIVFSVRGTRQVDQWGTGL